MNFNEVRPHIILTMQIRSLIERELMNAEDLIHLNEDGTVMMFPSLDEAVLYRDDNAIDGKIVSIPIY